MTNHEYEEDVTKFYSGPRGVRVIAEDRYIPLELVYPTGRKDGNKLGKYKRNLKEYQVLYDMYKSELYVHPSQIDRITKAFVVGKDGGFPVIKCIMFDSSTFWQPFKPVEPVEPMLDVPPLDGWCHFNIPTPIIKPITPIVMVTA